MTKLAVYLINGVTASLRCFTAVVSFVFHFFWFFFWVGAVLGLFLLLYSFATAEAERWAQFKADHNCRIVGQVDSHVNVGMGTTVGQDGYVSVTPVTTVTPGKTGWLCDDGITYWKAK